MFSRQRTASAVQPVWWLAPQPRPVSAWKYSQKKCELVPVRIGRIARVRTVAGTRAVFIRQEKARVDVQVIGATNRDLPAMMHEGAFRSDLFSRLSVLPVTMPPLGECGGNIPLLTMFLLEKFARELGRPVGQVSEETMHLLCGYSCPGNIRELQNVIARAVVLPTGPVLQVDASLLPQTAPLPLARLPAPCAPGAPATPLSPPAAGGGSNEEVEHQRIITVLQNANRAH